MSTVWKRVDPTKFNQDYEETQQRRSGSEYPKWSPKRGATGRPYRNVMRIAPPHINMDSWFVVYKGHFSLGPNQDVFCPCLDFFGKECQACLWNRECDMRGRSEPDPRLAGQYKNLAYRQRSQWNYVCTVMDMSRPEAGWLPYYHSNYVNSLLANAFNTLQQPPQWRDITDPERGYNVIMDVSMQLVRGDELPKYDLVVSESAPTPLIDMRLLEMIPDLTREVYEPNEAEVLAALQGTRIDRRAGNTGRMLTPAPAQGALPAPPGRVIQPPIPMGGQHAPAPVVVPPPAAAPQPAPAPPVETPKGRGRRAATGAQAPTPGALAPTPGTQPGPTLAPPPAAPVTPVPATPVRQAMTHIPGSAPAEPYAQARAYLATYQYKDDHGSVFQSVKPRDITPEEERLVPKQEIPPCYRKDTDPSDKTCRDCVLLLPCLTVTQGFTA